LPAPSSNLPGGGRDGPSRAGISPDSLLLGLAPSGVYRARPVTRPAGALLPHRFTLTGSPKGTGGILSVALSLSSRTVGVTHHCVLRSPDFPPRDESRGGRSAHSRNVILRGLRERCLSESKGFPTRGEIHDVDYHCGGPGIRVELLHETKPGCRNERGKSHTYPV